MSIDRLEQFEQESLEFVVTEAEEMMKRRKEDRSKRLRGADLALIKYARKCVAERIKAAKKNAKPENAAAPILEAVAATDVAPSEPVAEAVAAREVVAEATPDADASDVSPAKKSPAKKSSKQKPEKLSFPEGMDETKAKALGKELVAMMLSGLSKEALFARLTAHSLPATGAA
ncbi:MAG: hypothetical protein HUU29_14705 [Planctomycetaceae bacterium]|nr:hypothetical protein [Planctomycetaceae bacterium]